MDPLSKKDKAALQQIRRALRVKKVQDVQSSKYPAVCFNAAPEDEANQNQVITNGIREFLPDFSVHDLLAENRDVENVDLKEMECFTDVFEGKLLKQKRTRLLSLSPLPQVLERRARGEQRVTGLSVQGSTIDCDGGKQ